MLNFWTFSLTVQYWDMMSEITNLFCFIVSTFTSKNHAILPPKSMQILQKSEILPKVQFCQQSSSPISNSSLRHKCLLRLLFLFIFLTDLQMANVENRERANPKTLLLRDWNAFHGPSQNPACEEVFPTLIIHGNHLQTQGLSLPPHCLA